MGGVSTECISEEREWPAASPSGRGVACSLTLLIPSSQMYFHTSWEVAKELLLWTMGLLSRDTSACTHEQPVT